ncbi:hypothetical protein PHLCEN_2v11092, partial [Hermanssonia centrifuga]
IDGSLCWGSDSGSMSESQLRFGDASQYWVFIQHVVSVRSRVQASLALYRDEVTAIVRAIPGTVSSPPPRDVGDSYVTAIECVFSGIEFLTSLYDQRFYY